MINKIKSANNVAIFMHKNPDGDALSSAFALKLALQQLNKNAVVFLEEKLQNDEEMFGKYSYEIDIKDKFDLCISVDTAQASLLGKFADFFVSEKNLSIDHHPMRTSFSKNEILDNCTSCTMVILDIIQELKVNVTPEIATLLFFGLVTDSGRFMNTNTTARAYIYASKLLELGANANYVYDLLYRNDDIEEKKCLGTIYNKTNIKNGLASVLVTLDDNISMPQRFSSALISLKGVNVSVIVYETENHLYNLSFRSKPPYNVAKLAQIFGGGGHINASGANDIALSHQEIIEKIASVMESVKDE